jgi:hypothetical protein
MSEEDIAARHFVTLAIVKQRLRLASVSPKLSDRARRRAGGMTMPGYAGELAHRLAREAEAVCRRYLSNGRREGRYWLVGDVKNTPGPSMLVRLKGPESDKGSVGNGPTLLPASMATCWTSSARPAASPISTTLPTKLDAF